MIADLNRHSHRRFDILNGEWVLVSPHRSLRPWQGEVIVVGKEKQPAYEPDCYLCPGNKRANGEINPHYQSTYVFRNDYSALLDDAAENDLENGLLIANSERGICKVICFSPLHNVTLPQMSVNQILIVVKTWIKEFEMLSILPQIKYVQIFENKGSVMGCSNPHPHCQIWAQESVPTQVSRKQTQQLNYYKKNGSGLLEDYISQEVKEGERILYENELIIVLVPFWAKWPFEAMVLPKRRMPRISDMTLSEQLCLALAIQWLTRQYDRLFHTSFPYSSGFHQAPCDGKPHPEWHWHLSFYPPLLRSATVKKFMVGYEMFADPQRDITPESAANMIRTA